MAPPRKDAELHYGSILQRLRPELLYGRSLNPSESPDLLAAVPGSTAIGIEVTRYFRSDHGDRRPFQEQESLRDQIAQRARAKFEAQGGPPIFVGIHLNPDIDLKGSSVERVATGIADWIQRELPAIGETMVLESDWPLAPYMPPEVHLLHVGNLRALTAGSWGASMANFVPDLHPGEIQRVINRKEPEVIRYRQQAPNVWLLIVAEGRLSSSVRIQEQFEAGRYVSTFDRVFFLQAVGQRLYELTLAV